MDITVIGASIVDILAGPVDARVFDIGSVPVKQTRLSYGGDALNECIALSKLGKKASIITRLGTDEAGDRVYDYLKTNGVDVSAAVRDAGTRTSMNIVLVDQKGERCFLTDPEGSMRKLCKADVLSGLKSRLCSRDSEAPGGIFCLASLFVSTALSIADSTEILRFIKQELGGIVAMDMTKAKFGEKLSDLKGLLPFVDYIFPNSSEVSLLTGTTDPEENARLLIASGAGCAVVKCGSAGCIIGNAEGIIHVPGYPVAEVVDTTGAGDCFAAGFLYGLSQGMSVRDCACFANAMGSCAVERLGATDGIQSKAEVLRRFEALQG